MQPSRAVPSLFNLTTSSWQSAHAPRPAYCGVLDAISANAAGRKCPYLPNSDGTITLQRAKKSKKGDEGCHNQPYEVFRASAAPSNFHRMV
jgi:hypothetical protein